MITVILLAAGQSKRFGGIKQLAKIDGQQIINLSLDAFYANCQMLNCIERVVVVLGANSAKIEHHIAHNVDIYKVIKWQQGMGYSLSHTLKNIEINTSHILIALADQIEIVQCIIQNMLIVCNNNPTKIIAAQQNQQLGAPAIFPSSYLPELIQLSGDKGAKGIIQQHLNNVIPLDIPEAGCDIDTQEDLLLYIKKLSDLRQGTTR